MERLQRRSVFVSNTWGLMRENIHHKVWFFVNKKLDKTVLKKPKIYTSGFHDVKKEAL